MSTEGLEVLYMPKEMRLDLCVSLLESVGATSINVRDERDEIIHNCVMPWHTERRPSASLNWEKMVYRCLGCGSKGGILWLIGVTQGISGPEAREWLAGETGLGGKDFQLAPLLAYLDALDEAITAGGRRQQVVMPKFSESVLEPWNQICPWWTTGVEDLGIVGLGIPEQNLIEARVGWDLESNRIIIPAFWKGDLVGWQSRRLVDDGSPKYQSTAEFPRDRTIYGYDRSRKRALVVESPKSRLRHMHHLPIEATWGSVITESQVNLLKWHPQIVLWPDNDEAGWRVIEGYVDDRGVHHPGPAQVLQSYSEVFVVASDWHADPADLDDEEAARLYAEAVPLAVWERPKDALRCLACKEKHGGPCG